MKKWKKFMALGLTLSMALGMSACGSSSDTQEAASAQPASSEAAQEAAASETTGGGTTEEAKTYEPTTLTFWNGFTSTDGEVLQDIVDEFNETMSTTSPSKWM